MKLYRYRAVPYQWDYNPREEYDHCGRMETKKNANRGYTDYITAPPRTWDVRPHRYPASLCDDLGALKTELQTTYQYYWKECKTDAKMAPNMHRPERRSDWDVVEENCNPDDPVELITYLEDNFPALLRKHIVSWVMLDSGRDDTRYTVEGTGDGTAVMWLPCNPDGKAATKHYRQQVAGWLANEAAEYVAWADGVAVSYELESAVLPDNLTPLPDGLHCDTVLYRVGLDPDGLVWEADDCAELIGPYYTVPDDEPNVRHIVEGILAGTVVTPKVCHDLIVDVKAFCTDQAWTYCVGDDRDTVTGQGA